MPSTVYALLLRELFTSLQQLAIDAKRAGSGHGLQCGRYVHEGESCLLDPPLFSHACAQVVAPTLGLILSNAMFLAPLAVRGRRA